jgi:hypothetical protein
MIDVALAYFDIGQFICPACHPVELWAAGRLTSINAWYGRAFDRAAGGNDPLSGEMAGRQRCLVLGTDKHRYGAKGRNTLGLEKRDSVRIPKAQGAASDSRRVAMQAE